MAKHKSRDQRREEQRQRRVRLIGGILIISLMVLSSVAFIFYYIPASQQGSKTQVQLTTKGNLLYGTIDGRQMQFYSYPDQSLVVPPGAVSLLKNASTLVVLFNPNDTADLPYIDQIRYDFTSYLPLRPGAAVTQNSSQYPFPVANCSQATPQAPFIRIENGTQGISVNGSCIIFTGQQTDFLLLRDQLIYAYYGVR